MGSDVLDRLASAWPSPIVARSEVGHFSGGVLNPRSLANMDSLGRGPANRIRIGRKVAYPVCDLVEWMRERASPVVG